MLFRKSKYQARHSDAAFIDLHTHSTASDGSFTPSELVRYAIRKGLKAIALTDHDTVDGIAEAFLEAQRNEFEVIAGVEISVDFATEMHILGYFIDGDSSKISVHLEELREKRQERNIKTINKLNEMGFEITLEEAAAVAKGGNVGRPHIAKVLTQKGYTSSVKEAFDKYLSYGKTAYFKKEKLTPEQGISTIISAGGLPVLAHPIYLEMDETELAKLLKELKEAGLAGIEAYYSDNTYRQTQTLLKLARRLELAVTGGSDFHGIYKPDIDLGTGKGNLRVPYDILDELKSRSAK